MFIGVVNTFDAVKKKRRDNHLLDIVRLVASALFLLLFYNVCTLHYSKSVE